VDELWLALEDSLLSRSRRVADSWQDPRYQGYSPDLSVFSPRRKGARVFPRPEHLLSSSADDERAALGRLAEEGA